MKILNRYNAKMINAYNYVGVNSAHRKDDKYFIVTSDLSITLSNGDVIYIHKGYEFDGSSVPWYLRWWKSTYGEFILAALIHDWLYSTNYGRKRDEYGKWIKSVDKQAKRFADLEMLFWSDIVNNDTREQYRDNDERYWAVKHFGTKVFKK